MENTETDTHGKDMGEHIRLGSFIRDNIAKIAADWTHFAGTIAPEAIHIEERALKDHVEEILTFIAADLESFQTNHEQVNKSQGDGPVVGSVPGSAAEVHAALRLHDGFNLDQMVSEYRALRATVLRLWTDANQSPKKSDFYDMIRFNEAIDQVTTESISHFTTSLDFSRNLLLGILGHDLRGPISAASLSAELMLHRGTLDASQAASAMQISNCSLRAGQILDDLLDLTRTQFGSELPVSRRRIDLAPLTQQLVAEMQALHPNRVIDLQISGDTNGNYDKVRMGQVLSNLIGNAIQHGSQDSHIMVNLNGEPQTVVLSIHNEGPPIPSSKMDTIFKAFVRGKTETRQKPVGSPNVGLGLYITKNIVDSHVGTIQVTSDQVNGTTFTARMPRI